MNDHPQLSCERSEVSRRLERRDRCDFLLELRSEEVPARMQAGARADLEKLFRKEMAAAGVALGEVTVWSTPRRLALIARDLPDGDRRGQRGSQRPANSARRRRRSKAFCARPA